MDDDISRKDGCSPDTLQRIIDNKTKPPGSLGRIEEARETIDALHQMEPEFSISWFRENYPPVKGDYGAVYVEALQKAGVPG